MLRKDALHLTRGNERFRMNGSWRGWVLRGDFSWGSDPLVLVMNSLFVTHTHAAQSPNGRAGGGTGEATDAQ